MNDLVSVVLPTYRRESDMLARAVTSLLNQTYENTEIIITGRKPEKWLLDEADYITEMGCIRHPHNDGIPAREGVEY